MGILKLLIPTVVLVCIILLGGLCYLYYANDMNTNFSGMSGTYGDQAHFQISMNWLISLVISNLGYVLALLLIIGLFIGAFGYITYQWLSG